MKFFFPSPIVMAGMAAAETAWMWQNKPESIGYYIYTGIGFALTVLLFFFATESHRRAKEAEAKKRDDQHADNLKTVTDLKHMVERLTDAENRNREIRHNAPTRDMENRYRFEHIEQWAEDMNNASTFPLPQFHSLRDRREGDHR